MKITVYTIKDCAFSKQEKEYLNTNKLVFEEKDLETNKDFLTEMLAISNNFAGTPVTRVEKDDGTIAVLKGFTKAEFDTVFGFVTAEAKPPVETSAPAEPVNPAPVEPTIAPEIPKVEDKPLNEVMDKLNSKIVEEKPAVVTPDVSPPPAAPPVQPTMTDSTNSTTPPAGAPTIPDFPTK
ncbi:MAG: glutaredoxin family protein [Patescibacteria group bacterium]|jgi:glutaredoxin